jgi:hypothetical protein
MATTLKNYSTATQLDVTATSIHATLVGETAFVGQLSFTNTSALAVEVIVYKLPNADTETPGSGGNWLAKRTIQPGKTWSPLSELGNLVMSEEQTLSATAGTTAVINAESSGTVET